LGLSRFDEAKNCFESLRSLGEGALAETCLKKLDDIQERVENYSLLNFDSIFFISIKVSKTSATTMPKTEGK